ncbi:Cilia- and flagella-associated protein 61 [Lamellibrachia satsuma]|nr:Cilia- and flagella-associated protein 61 [Lamellibrachia satsuma]
MLPVPRGTLAVPPGALPVPPGALPVPRGTLPVPQGTLPACKAQFLSHQAHSLSHQLANALLTLFDPTLEQETPPPRDLLKLIPMYRSPKICGCFLPGEYHYLFVGKPKLNTPLEALRSQSDFGVEMVTGNIQGDPGYFCLHLNQYKSVEDITCLSKKPFPTSNLICLYSIHERFLNNLIYRFKVKLITDFYKFFQDKGLMAVYHDRYPDFREEVRELLVTRPEPNRESLEEKIRHMFEEDISLFSMQDELSENQLRYLKEEFVQSGAKRAVETRLLSFLSYNAYHLPMYAKPGMV